MSVPGVAAGAFNDLALPGRARRPERPTRGAVVEVCRISAADNRFCTVTKFFAGLLYGSFS